MISDALEMADGQVMIQRQRFNSKTENSKQGKTEVTSDFSEVQNSYDLKNYKMNHGNRGMAVIINLFKFKKTSVEWRHGTAKDAENLKEVLENKLKFEVILLNDPTRNAICDELTRVSELDHRDNDCLLVVIMTHGQKDGVVSAFDGVFQVEELWEKFKGENCKSLIGKPKLFFVQACRGGDAGKGVEFSTSNLVPDAQSNYITIPEYADHLTMYSTYDGNISVRDQKNGTWFIQELCQQLEINVSDDLMSILTVVSRKVALRNGEIEHQGKIEPTKQIPIIVSSLTKKVYFYDQTKFCNIDIQRVFVNTNKLSCDEKSSSIAVYLPFVAFAGFCFLAFSKNS